MPEPDATHCAQCGGPLPVALGGLCPRCMLMLGMEPPTPAPVGTPWDDGLDDPPTREWMDVPKSQTATDLGDAPERYQLLGEIARGGMGAVLRGHDSDLERELAIKVLLEVHRDRPDLVRRFFEEARIGGQLQHPGIVPVYELGRFADRRPFFTMKLVRGRTLADMLAERIGLEADRPQFLGIFEQICQTMAYAHSRGVIHRDLKPSNIMVGRFGEVQVMDWGLAKVLTEVDRIADPFVRPNPGVDAEPTMTTARGGLDDPETRTGSVMGTPGYMSPEQARGEIERVDERVDVFALGAILCEILTGAPAYRGGPNRSPREQAMRADLDDAIARIGASGAESELLDLARACLEEDPKDRPRDARRVASRVFAHLRGVQERLQAAELARVEALARAEGERARRRAVMRLSAALVMVLATGIAGVATQWRRAETNLRSSIEANTELALANRREVEARDQAMARVTLAIAAIDQYTRGVTEDVHLREPQMDALRGRLLESALVFSKRLQAVLEAEPGAGTRADLAEAYERVADITSKTGARPAAIEAFERAVAIRERLALAHPDQPGARAALARDRNLLAGHLSQTGRPTESLALAQKAQADYEQLTRDHPEALEYQAGLAEATTSLGYVLAKQGLSAEATATFERSAAAFERLARADPRETRYREGLARALYNLSIRLLAEGRRDQGLTMLGRSVDAIEHVSRERPQDVGVRGFVGIFQVTYGKMLDDAGKERDALRAYRRSEEVYERLLAELPNNIRFQDGLARARNGLGTHFANIEMDGEKALVEFRKARTVLEKLASDNPKVTQVLFNLAECRLNAGIVLRTLRRPGEALLEVEPAAAIYERLVSEEPASIENRRNLAQAQVKLASLHRLLEHGDDAVKCYRRAMELFEKLPEPDAADLYDLACSHARLAVQAPGAGEAVNPARREESEAHLSRAMTALGRAVAAGFRDANAMREDSDLVPLHARRDFRLLLLDAAFPDDPFGG